MEVTFNKTVKETKTIEIPSYYTDGVCHWYGVFGDGENDIIQVCKPKNSGSVNSSISKYYKECVLPYQNPCTKEDFESAFNEALEQINSVKQLIPTE